MMSPRSAAEQIDSSLPVVARAALPVATRLLAPGGRRARLSILIYHRVLDTVDPMRAATTTKTEFDWQMRLLARHFNVLPLGEAVDRLLQGDLPYASACITFDDGYADNYEVALPILKRYGLTASFFIAVGFLDGGRMFNDTVIESVRNAPGPRLDLSDCGLGVHAIDGVESRRLAGSRILSAIKSLHPEERQDRIDRISERSPPGPAEGLMMTRAQVVELARAGMDVGGHTVNHPILASLHLADAEREIAQGKAELEGLLDRSVPHFAYPNGRPGRDYLPEHVSLVRRIGFRVAVSTSPGVSRARSDRFQLPRFTPWDRSPARFVGRLLHNCTRAAADVCDSTVATAG